MPDLLYFPRLPRDTARTLLAEYTDLTIPQLVERSTLDIKQSFWYPTAPSSQRVTSIVIARFQQTIREVASKHGYPRESTSRNPERGQFDREIVDVILDIAPMFPAEAAQEGVWSFLSLVVLPDVALWRWPNKKQRQDYERILGYPRNVFRRLWWRAFLLGTEGASVGAQVFEDEAVAILERTRIGGNRRLARAIAETHVQRFASSAKRTEIMRDAMKRMRRLNAFVSFHSLNELELRRLVDEVFDEAEKSLLT